MAISTLEEDLQAVLNTPTEQAGDRVKTQRLEVNARFGKLFCLLFLLAVCVYLATAASVRQLSFDELLSWHTAQVSTGAELIHIQESAPVSLDPPLFHLINHGLVAAGINATFAIRTSALLGTLVLLLTTWLFVERMVGPYVACFTAMSILVTENYHLTEGRPYGVLLACAGTALLSWQSATRRREAGRERVWALCGVFIGVFIASGVHYFGVLLSLPFFLVESVRWYRSRKLDGPLLCCIVLGLTSVVTWLPFLRAAKEYKASYYSHVSFHDLLWAYTLPVSRLLHFPSIGVDLVIASVLLGVMATGLRLGWLRLRRPDAAIAEWYLVGFLVLLPFFGVALSTASSGAFESRYVIEYCVGISIALSSGFIALVPKRAYRIACVIAGACLVAMVLLRSSVIDAKNRATTMVCAQRISDRGTVVLENDEAFLRLDEMRRLNPSLRIHPLWVADMQKEVLFQHSDNVDRTMLNLKHWSSLPVSSYEELVRDHSAVPLLSMQGERKPSWIQSQFEQDGYRITPDQQIDACKMSTVSLR